MAKNKQQTMQRLMKAAGEEIVLTGVDRVRLTYSAQRAGVNKDLIYRYFGGWYPLLEALFQQLLLQISSVLTLENRFLAWQTYLSRFYRHLQDDPAFLVLFRYLHTNPETEFGQRLAQLLESSISEITAGAQADADIVRLVLAGITYSVLVQHPAHVTDLNEQAIHQIFDQLSRDTQPVTN